MHYRVKLCLRILHGEYQRHKTNNTSLIMTYRGNRIIRAQKTRYGTITESCIEWMEIFTVYSLHQGWPCEEKLPDDPTASPEPAAAIHQDAMSINDRISAHYLEVRI